MVSASVIVPIFNGRSYLPAFFSSLDAAMPSGTQLVLVDDASTETVWDTVPEFANASDVERIQNDHNVGYASTVNRGFASATGDIVIQLNTDLVLDADCITAMIRLIEKERDVGIVGSKLVFPTSGLVDHVGVAFGMFSRRRIFGQLPTGHPMCNVTRELQVVSGATVAMTREVLKRLGPLDERYYNLNEDKDHCLVARTHGLRNFMCHESVAYHWKSHSGPARFARVSSAEGRFWARWGSSITTDLGRFVDEGLDHVRATSPVLFDYPFEVLDLSRDADQAIVLEALAQRWPHLRGKVRDVRQTNKPSGRLHLPLLLPHWTVLEPTPFLYLVDSYRDLTENAMWFEQRRRVVDDELIVDLNGVAVPTSEVIELT